MSKVHTGDLFIYSQKELNDLDVGLTEITGKLNIRQIKAPEITDLSKLRGIEKVGGNIQIRALKVTNLDCLNNLKEADNITIDTNDDVVNINLSKLTKVRNLSIQSFSKLTSVDLTSLINSASLRVVKNTLLTEIKAGSLTITDSVLIQENPELVILDLSKLITVDKELKITQNGKLKDCCSIKNFLVNGKTSQISISENGPGCNSKQEVIDSCTQNHTSVGTESKNGIEPAPYMGNVTIENRNRKSTVSANWIFERVDNTNNFVFKNDQGGYLKKVVYNRPEYSNNKNEAYQFFFDTCPDIDYLFIRSASDPSFYYTHKGGYYQLLSGTYTSNSNSSYWKITKR